MPEVMAEKAEKNSPGKNPPAHEPLYEYEFA
jgi:hypothetical protein